MRLGTLLLRDAVITLTQLEQSLRAQVLGGGRLGTNLIELGFVDINTLGRYLARAMDVPLAIADRFDKATPEILEKLGAELADHYTAIPLGLVKDEPHTMAVAMSMPLDGKIISGLERALKMAVKPYVAPELRLVYYLERYYGIKRQTRFTRAPDKDSEQKPRRERRATQPFRGLASPPTIQIQPQRKRNSGAVASRPPEALSFEEACKVVDGANERDDIADAVLQFTTGRFECAAVFMIRAQNAIGWRARAPGLGADALTRMNIPLGGASVFQAAHDTSAPYRGSALSAGHPTESELWSMLAIDHEPNDMHVIPICIEDRIVNLVYAHAFPGSPASMEEAEQLVRLVSRCGHAYQRMLAESQA